MNQKNAEILANLFLTSSDVTIMMSHNGLRLKPYVFGIIEAGKTNVINLGQIK